MPQEEWPTVQAQRDIITSDFDKSTPYGDRRQVCPARCKQLPQRAELSKSLTTQHGITVAG